MKKISITGSGLSTLCRLCLSSDVVLLDIFQFSSKMKENVANVIMKCAAVQITRIDEMPKLICQSCYTQLEKTHQFVMQIEQSDTTLRHYLQKLSDQPTKADCTDQPEDLIPNTNKDIAKCKPNDLPDWKETTLENFNQENKHEIEMFLKSELKVGMADDFLFLQTECAAGTDDISSTIDGEEFSSENSKTKESEVNLKENESENYILTNKLMDKISVKLEISDENMDDDLVFSTESVDDMENPSSNADGNEISFEDTQMIGQASENSCFYFVNVTENFSKCDETNKINRKKSQKAPTSKSYQCDICNKCFYHQSTLYSHKRTHIGKPYKCNVCIKCFNTSAELKTHQRVHTGEKPYQCKVCKKCFSMSSHLKTHSMRHTGEKPFQCDICEKRFIQLCDLNRHKLVHTGEKPYQCDICKKNFTQSYYIKHHMLTHTGEKPYKCEFCGKCFSTSSYVNLHKRIHTGEKPYKCDFCEKPFSNLSNLNSHKRFHSDEKPYECDICMKCFTQSSDLSRHKRIHTRE